MNFVKSSLTKMSGILGAVIRFPVSTFFFVVCFLFFNAMTRSTTTVEYEWEMLGLIVGAVAAATGQVIYERFYRGKTAIRWGIYLGIVCLTFLFYWFFLRKYAEVDAVITIRTLILISVLISILWVGFLWIPTIRNTITFSTVFMVSLKGFFTALLFSIVLEIGIISIIIAFIFLIRTLSFTLFFNITYILFGVFLPLYYLSSIPDFSASEELRNEKDLRALAVPKTLEVLISYIVIPLLLAYTAILLLYIVPNLTGQFWYDNLLEPLLVSYSVVGFFTLFLSEKLTNPIAVLFKKHFPKLLLIIAAFQTLASILKIQQFGITHGRYYVILYGVFSIVSSVIYVFFKKKESYIPALFILLSAVSITPPIDALTVGINAQVRQVESVLEKNNMLQENTIVKSETISLADRVKIADSINYLYHIDELDRLEWLPSGFSPDYNYFEATFGFNQYTYDFENEIDSQTEVIEETEDIEDIEETEDNLTGTVELEDPNSISTDLNEADYFAMVPVSYNMSVTNTEQTFTIPHNETDLTMQIISDKETFGIELRNDLDETLLFMDLQVILDEALQSEYPYTKPLEDLTYDEENDQAAIRVIVNNLNINYGNFYGELYVFTTIKNQ